MQRIRQRCSDTRLKSIIEAKPIRQYVDECLKRCLLMAATDPPVVIIAPGWQHILSEGEIMDLGNETVEKQQHRSELTYVQECFSRDSKCSQEVINNHDSRKSSLERLPLNKSKCKEYTTKGGYVDFIVWPVLYLHDGGAQMAKGIAQGSEERYRTERECVWKWWK